MAFFGLFGKKDKSKDSESKDSAYFLDQDSSKTYGNIEFMKTGKGYEIKTTSNPSTEPISQPTSESTKNTRLDSNMDIFLKMAKDINKK